MKYGYETTDRDTYRLLLEKAKEMRNNPTEAESLLWKGLSGNTMGVHFRQQHPVLGYIPDFICLRLRLIIEIDGGYHLQNEQIEKDIERQKELEHEGYTVLRFTNEQVFYDTQETLEIIKDTIEELSHKPSSPLPLGGAGGGCRVGFGFDVHRLVPNRDLWLCGIRIPHTLGLLGHSDADVAIHAICDALLGAANLRDIGYHFPDTAKETLNVDSKILLRKTMQLVAEKGYTLGNVDVTICAERPKLNPHIPAMKACLAEVMQTDEDNVSIKATTTERLGFTGREEGMAAYATVLIEKA